MNILSIALFSYEIPKGKYNYIYPK